MSQLLIFSAPSGPTRTVSSKRPQLKTRLAASSSISTKAPSKRTVSIPDPYGICQVCGMAIAIPGLTSSLCSNPDRSCGSLGWVSTSQVLVEATSIEGGAA